MGEKKIVISIITVCYNCQDTIKKTIESVISQTYPDIQYIIIDGGSKDNTLHIISTFKDRIDTIISEKDAGIYDAMNKGLKYTTGDIIYFLNSGDKIFAPDTVEKIVTLFEVNSECSLIHGDAIKYGDQPDEYCSMYRENRVVYFTRGLCHQTLFTRKQLFEIVGDFDQSYSVFADRDWLFRCLFRHNKKILHITEPICYFLTGGFSSWQDEKFFREKIRLSLKYLRDKRFLLLMMKNPRELFQISILISYSFMNVISFMIFRHGIRRQCT